MNDRNKPTGHPVLVALALALFIAGLLAWVWIGEWRYAITGLGAGLLALIMSTTKLRP